LPGRGHVSGVFTDPGTNSLERPSIRRSFCMLLATNWISCPVSDHSFNVWSGGTNEQNDKSDGGFAAGSILYRRLFAAWKWYAGSGQWNAERHIDRPFRLEQTSGDCTTKFGHRNVHCSASHGRAAPLFRFPRSCSPPRYRSQLQRRRFFPPLQSRLRVQPRRDQVR